MSGVAYIIPNKNRVDYDERILVLVFERTYQVRVKRSLLYFRRHIIILSLPSMKGIRALFSVCLIFFVKSQLELARVWRPVRTGTDGTLALSAFLRWNQEQKARASRSRAS